ncbi:MAG: TCP-1/cpn60 chaperonin family protein [Nitrososphaerota archaeon]|nr:TCP-1/cpn60 chaperonin family protein [Nitrososphaerota archaeon]
MKRAVNDVFDKRRFLGYLSGVELRGYIRDVAIFFKDLISPMFGPYGNWKLVIDCEGECTLTNCGGVLLEALKYRAVKSPLARMFIEEGLLHDKVVGDGVKYFLLLSSILVEKGIRLLESGLSFHEIISGYEIATKSAVQYLEEISHITFSRHNLTRDIIHNLLITTTSINMLSPSTSKYNSGINKLCKYLSSLYISNKIPHIYEEDVLIIRIPSGSSSDTKLLRGILIRSSSSEIEINKSIKNPRIIIIRKPQRAMRGDKDKLPSLRDMELRHEIVVKTPSDLKKYIQEEEKIWDEYVNLLRQHEVNAIFSGGKLNIKLSSRLKRKNIILFENLDEKLLKALSKISGARLLSSINDLKSEDYGFIRGIEGNLLGSKKFYMIKPFEDKKLPITIIIKGPEYFMKNIEHHIKKLRSIYNMLTEKQDYVPAGGATEVSLAIRIRENAQKNPTKQQISIMVYADAIEELVRILIQNMGLDPLEVLPELRHIHISLKDGVYYGVNAFTRKIENMINNKVVELCEIKKRTLLKTLDFVKTIMRLGIILFQKQEMEEVPSKIGRRFINA